MALIVKSAFGDYQRGDKITDQAQIDAALVTNAHHVVRVADAPAPAPAPKKAAAQDGVPS